MDEWWWYPLTLRSNEKMLSVTPCFNSITTLRALYMSAPLPLPSLFWWKEKSAPSAGRVSICLSTAYYCPELFFSHAQDDSFACVFLKWCKLRVRYRKIYTSALGICPHSLCNSFGSSKTTYNFISSIKKILSALYRTDTGPERLWRGHHLEGAQIWV